MRIRSYSCLLDLIKCQASVLNMSDYHTPAFKEFIGHEEVYLVVFGNQDLLADQPLHCFSGALISRPGFGGRQTVFN